MRKRLCVLQVTPTHPNPDHVKFFNNDNCDFYFVTHDEPHEEAMQFCPNTTWTDTRNILAEKVPKQYEYYAFVDYDYVLKPQGDKNALEQILEDLSIFNPAVLTYYPGEGLITPFATNTKYFESFEYSIIPFTHCGLKIIHHSLLDWFFPMITDFGGGVEACHLFNILELPFMKNVVCSHEMVYDNSVSDPSTPHNKGSKMSEMWQWLRPSFKKDKILNHYARNEHEKNNPFLIKQSFVDLITRKGIKPEKSNVDVDYYDIGRMSDFFDMSHEWFVSKNKR